MFLLLEPSCSCIDVRDRATGGAPPKKNYNQGNSNKCYNRKIQDMQLYLWRVVVVVVCGGGDVWWCVVVCGGGVLWWWCLHGRANLSENMLN